MKLLPLYRVCFTYPEGWGVALSSPSSTDGQHFIASASHLSDHEKYRWLNDGLAVGEGEVRTVSEDHVELVIDWSEVIWEPIAE